LEELVAVANETEMVTEDKDIEDIEQNDGKCRFEDFSFLVPTFAEMFKK